MRGKRKDGKPIVRTKLPARRKNVTSEPIPGSIGALLHKERTERNISQSTAAAQLAKHTGGGADNVRVSHIELGKKLPSDNELRVFANLYRLSAATLREKRDASTRRPWKPKKSKTVVVNAPKPAARLAAKTVTHARPAPADPAGAPAVADWIEIVDGVVRMPIDPGDRKRWFAATMELFALRGKQ